MLIDISPPLTPEIAVFPGDTALSREVLMDIERGDHLTLSTLRTTVHVGAHLDGANHYGKTADGRAARAIDEQPLDLGVGPCLVVRVAGDTPRVTVEQFEAGLVSIDIATIDDLAWARVLLATDSYPDPNHWNDDFRALEPDLVAHLAARGTRLVGIDTPSVDTADSKDLPGHAACFAHDVAILEGLVLREVTPGAYELIALPLRLVGFDASPVRAVLRR